jgi:phage host-nuclease inhibitor protein Gam
MGKQKTKERSSKARAFSSWEMVDGVLPMLKSFRARLAYLIGRQEVSISRVKETFDPQIEEVSGKIKILEAGILDFVAEHRADLDEQRSRALRNGRVGLRWGPPKLVTMSRTTWAKVLERALELPGRIRGLFVEEKPSLQKEELSKAIAEEKIDEQTRRQLGVDRVQEEFLVCEIP